MPHLASAPEATRRARAVRHVSAQLRQRAQAQRTRSRLLRRRYLLVVCSGCAKPIRWQCILWEAPTAATSHGLCPACFEQTMRELGKLGQERTLL